MKLNRKWMLLVALVLSVAMATTGTLAYLTDTDADVNVMTLGKVEIVQNEQQRVIGADGLQTDELEEFEQGKPLMPYTVRDPEPEANTVKVGEYEVKRNRTYNNYIDKIVSVTNTGKSDAYVRTLVAIPTGGSDWEPNPVKAADVWLHWNTVADMDKYWHSVYTNEDNYSAVLAEINGQGYYVWEFTHKEALTANETTFPTLLGCFMDMRVNHDDTGYYMDMNSNGLCDTGDKRMEDLKVGETVEILVLSQAVQADGFSDPQIALDTAFGDVNPENAQTWFQAIGKEGGIDVGSPGEKWGNNNPPLRAEVSQENPANAGTENNMIMYDITGSGTPVVPEQLDCYYIFTAADTGDEAAAGPYGSWHADYVVSFDKDVPAGAAGLAGQYESFMKEWIGLVSLDEPVPANTELRLLYMFGGAWTYEDVCEFVQVFKCGAFDYNDALAGTTMTVQLCVFETDENGNELDKDPYVVGEYKHTFTTNGNNKTN